MHRGRLALADTVPRVANAGRHGPGLPSESRVTSGDDNIEMLLGNHVEIVPRWSGIGDVEGLNATLHILHILRIR